MKKQDIGTIKQVKINYNKDIIYIMVKWFSIYYKQNTSKQFALYNVSLLVVDFSIILNRWLNIYKYNDIMQAKKEGGI